MRIQFKQDEIIAALKQHIVNQGISLVGKAVTVEFTAGRTKTGLLADINISEDNFIPGIDDAQVEVVEEPTMAKPSLMVVTAAPVEAQAELAEPAAPAPEVAPTKSLFG